MRTVTTWVHTGAGRGALEDVPIAEPGEGGGAGQTGATSARFFTVTFRCLDGTTWTEIARTTVQT